MVFLIKNIDKNSNARIGIIKTKKGEIETPFFMPVATKASVKHISSEDLKQLGAKAVISNAFILTINNGEKIIKKAGGLGKFMNFSGINVTDSGGFQMYSEALYKSSNDRGVFFINPKSHEEVFMTPERNMQLQFNLGSEIAMCLDSMPLYPSTKKEIAESVRKTTLWAKRCKKQHSRLNSSLRKNQKQLLFGITQGGIYKELREQSCYALKTLDFDGYSIGGLGLGEPREKMLMTILIHKQIIGPEKPCYLMGVGHPVEILEAIALGVDMFDSRYPTQNARRGTIFTWRGKLKILNKKYETDFSPLNDKCDCFVCKNYSRAYIRYQLKQEEPVGMRLASFHNLYFILKLIERAKEEIKKGTFLKFKKKFIDSWKE